MNRTDEIKLAGFLHKAKETTSFPRKLTLNEMTDIVHCLHIGIAQLEYELTKIEDHLIECNDPECNKAVQFVKESLEWKLKDLYQRVNDFGPALHYQCEQLEAGIAKHLGMLPPEEEEETKNDAGTGDGAVEQV